MRDLEGFLDEYLEFWMKDLDRDIEGSGRVLVEKLMFIILGERFR